MRRDGEKTIGGLSREFGDRSFAAAVLVLMFVPALPLPTGGISHVFEVTTVFGLVVIVFAVTAALALAILFHDLAVLAAALLVGVGGIALVAAAGAVVARSVGSVF